MMTKFLIFLFLFVLSLAYGQLIGVLPTSNSEAEEDWISIGLVLCFFCSYLLFISTLRMPMMISSNCDRETKYNMKFLKRNNLITVDFGGLES